jgi:hypothetical protein
MVMVCPNVVIGFASQLLAIGTVAGAIAGTSALAFLFSRATDSKLDLDANPQRKQKLQEAAARKPRAATGNAVAARPRAATQMKDLARLQTALAGAGRRITATDRSLVLTMKELTLSFEHDAQGVIVATLVRGEVKPAQDVMVQAQTRYLAAVRESTLANVEAAAPRAGWQVAARSKAGDGSIQVTLQKPRPKKAVAIG